MKKIMMAASHSDILPILIAVAFIAILATVYLVKEDPPLTERQALALIIKGLEQQSTQIKILDAINKGGGK